MTYRWLFPSPYRGYHLSTIIVIINIFVCISFRPLIGVIIFQRIKDGGYSTYPSFRPLIGVIIFQHIWLICYYSPYMVSVPLSGLSSFNRKKSRWFLWRQRVVSVPLSGLSSFNLQKVSLHHGASVWVSVPLSGLSSFNLCYTSYRFIYANLFPSPYRGYHLSTLT